jgi:hypothetical protein
MVRPPYQAVVRLYQIADGHWHYIDGEAAITGAGDLLTLPIDRFCNAISWWALQRVKDSEKFLFDLNKPFPGQVTESDVEQEMADFAAFAAAVGVAKPAAVDADA